MEGESVTITLDRYESYRTKEIEKDSRIEELQATLAKQQEIFIHNMNAMIKAGVEIRNENQPINYEKALMLIQQPLVFDVFWHGLENKTIITFKSDTRHGKGV